MRELFELDIPKFDQSSLKVPVRLGEIVYFVGANGTGKSALITRLFNVYHNEAKKISAHRQTWFRSNSADLTGANRASFENSIKAQDAQFESRYRMENSERRVSVALYDLIDAQTTRALEITGYVDEGKSRQAEKASQNPSVLNQINSLLALSNIPISIDLVEHQSLVARKGGSEPYSIAELSDGERNAFLIAAEVLTAKPNSLVLIDEPERHLHHSIVVPLLQLLFEERPDCAFVVSTHQLSLAFDGSKSSVFIVRECKFERREAKSWEIDQLNDESGIDDELRKAILGARKQVIFVEGASNSLDAPMYNLLFPGATIIPAGNCKNVERAVKGLRGADDLHWVSAWGIVDNDQRGEPDIMDLKSAGIWAISKYSIESIYYSSFLVKEVARRQSKVTGDDWKALVAEALSLGIESAKEQRDHLTKACVLRSVRRVLMEKLPSKKSLCDKPKLQIEIDIQNMLQDEQSVFDKLVMSKDWDGLVAKYPLRESTAFGKVVSTIKIGDTRTYRSAVLKLLQEDEEVLKKLRNEFNGLYEMISENAK